MSANNQLSAQRSQTQTRTSVFVPVTAPVSPHSYGQAFVVVTFNFSELFVFQGEVILQHTLIITFGYKRLHLLYNNI